MLLRGIGLALLGQVGYDGKPGRTWIVWSGWVPGGIDDGGTGKLTLSAALSDPLLNLLEDVGHVEGQMVRRCRHHRDLGPASANFGRTSACPARIVTMRESRPASAFRTRR